MKAIAIAVLLAGCASVPRPFPTMPNGLTIVRMDQASLFKACGGLHNLADDGKEIGHYQDIVGCYKGNTILIEDSCRGAKALVHELAHSQGIADPDKAGYGWKE